MYGYGGVGCAGAASKYDLVANLVHDGAAARGVYRAHIQRRSEGAWYEVQDLHVVDILPQARPLLEQVHGLELGVGLHCPGGRAHAPLRQLACRACYLCVRVCQSAWTLLLLRSQGSHAEHFLERQAALEQRGSTRLRVSQMVVLSETYAQIYERQAPGASRTARAAAA